MPILDLHDLSFIVYIIAIWACIDLIYYSKRDFWEKHGVKLYYGFILMYRRDHAFRRLKIVSKLSYILLPFMIYGAFILYSTMIMAILAKLGIASISAKPRILVPGINIVGIDLLYFSIAVLVTALIHELSHAYTASSRGISVKGIGFALIFIIPIAFTEMNEESFNKSSSRDKVLVLSSGPAANVVAALLFALVLTVAISPTGLLIVDIEKNSLAEQYGLRSYTIISHINGTPATLENLRSVLSENKTITIDLEVTFPNGTSQHIRVLKPGNVSRLGVYLTYAPSKALMDAIGVENALALIGLLRWLYLVNLSIGVLNIAPLFVTDGARIIQEIGGSRAAFYSSIITLAIIVMAFIP